MSMKTHHLHECAILIYVLVRYTYNDIIHHA